MDGLGGSAAASTAVKALPGPGPLRMALRYAGASLRSRMQYRSSFLMESLGHLIAAVTEFLGIVALFSRFGSIRDWTVSEVAFFYGVVHVVFAVAEGVGRGFDSLESHVKNGTFDRVLLRPRSTLLQVLGAALAPETIGRLLLAGVVLAWALAALDDGPAARDVALLLWAFAGGVAAFFALLMLSAAVSFWTTETLLIFAIVTKGGLETTQYPIAVFHRALRYLFLFLVPIGTVTYFPVVQVLGRPDPLGASAVVAWLAPLAGFIFLILVSGIWQLGVRHYTSTGS